MSKLTFPVGIEIETLRGNYDRSRVPATWEQVEDISCGLEFRSGKIETSEALFDEVPQICHMLQDWLVVDNRCGLHVHLGFKHLQDLTAKYRLGRFLHYYEDLIFSLLAPNPTRARYCQKLPDNMWHGMQNGRGFLPWYDLTKDPTLGGSHRYWWLNANSMHRHGTLEFRVMNGTLYHNQILGWVSLLQCIFDAACLQEVKLEWEAPETDRLNPNKLLEDCKASTNQEFGTRAKDFVRETCRPALQLSPRS